jgi:tetratricopeptide (TPR) repeat protein
MMLFLALAAAGCSVHRSLVSKPTSKLAADPALSTLGRAELLRTQGDYAAAAIEFRKVIDCTEDDHEREQARIGAAKSLIAMHRLPAAMTALGALPVEPASETDCRKLALAGEIYLRQRRSGEAEPCLELALDACPLETILARAAHGAPTGPVTAASHQAPAAGPQPAPEVIAPGVPLGPVPSVPGAPSIPGAPIGAVPDGPAPPWVAGCAANLGCAYLNNDKPEKAAALYAFAAQQFRMQGNHVAAERAQRVCADLNAVLCQYAPYKPPPLTQRLPPGRK